MLCRRILNGVGVLAVLLTICCVSFSYAAPPAPLVHYALDEVGPWPNPPVNTGTATNANAALQGWAKMYTVSNTPNNYSDNAVSFYEAWSDNLYGCVEMVTDSAELDNLSSLTVTFWVNMRDDPLQYGVLFDTGGRFGTGGTYLAIAADPCADAFNVDFFVIGAGNWIPSAVGHSPSTYDADNKWTFMAVTYGSDTMQFFTGGDAVSASLTQIGGDVTGVDYQGNPSHTGVDPVSRLTVGCAAGQTGWTYTPPAWMDDFRIYDSVLTPSELEMVRQLNLIPEGQIVLAADVVGTVNIEGYSGDPLDLMARIEFRQGGSPVRTDRVLLDGSGQFTVEGVTYDTYDIAVYVHNCLQTVLTAVDVSANPTDLGVITLAGGDANSDNSIDLRDFSLLSANWSLSGDL